MNPRRAPRPRPPRDPVPDAASTSPRPDAADAVVDAAFARWRGAYDGITPAPDFLARARRAAHAATRRRRRPAAAALAAAVCTAFVGAFLATRIAARVAGGWTDAPPTGAVACAGTQGPVAVAAPSAVRGDASGAPARRPRPDRLVADTSPAGADGAARLASLLASATALPRPDAATREAWVLASFDPDPRVREAAALLLALAHPAAPSPVPPPPTAATDATTAPAAVVPAAADPATDDLAGEDRAAVVPAEGEAATRVPTAVAPTTVGAAVGRAP